MTQSTKKRTVRRTLKSDVSVADTRQIDEALDVLRGVVAIPLNKQRIESLRMAWGTPERRSSTDDE